MKTRLQVGIIVLLVTGFALLGEVWSLSTDLLQPPPSECSKDLYLYCNTPSELGLAFRSVMIETSDDISISGWYIPGKKNYPGILMIPGWGETRHVALRYVPSLNAQGFNLLLIDLRANGESEGDHNTMGLDEKKDIVAGITYLLKTKRLPSAGVFGFSTGAGPAIMAMAENDQIAAGIFESAYSDLEPLIQATLKKNQGSVAAFFHPLVTWMFEKRLQCDRKDLSPLIAIRKISPRPVFIIHGMEDKVSDFEWGKELFWMAKEPKRFWPVQGGGYLQSWQTDRTRAEKEIPQFFLTYLMPREGSH